MAYKNLILIILSVFITCTSCKKTETLISTAYTKSTVAYKANNGVAPNLLSLDIYHFGQTTPNTPIVIWVHGGGWILGDKANSLTNKLNLFWGLNYIFVSVNYRLSPSVNPPEPNRIMYPIHNIDVADAVKWIYDSIKNYGGNNQKIVLLGHSAGAHLVSLSGTSALFLPTRGIPLNTIKGIASIDTEGYDINSQAGAGEEIYINAFGTNPSIWTEASPIQNLFSTTIYPKFFIAKRGTTSRIALADAFITKLQTVGVTVLQVNGSQYDHEGINAAIGAPGETAITEPLKTFLAQCFL
ncbi:MAG: alpha/beta hydrolase [Limnohabitans sp.]|nr:alpha/beta hydrolase [Limnohabitans sp.]